MGHRLSDLQKTILRLALENRTDESRGATGSNGADVYYAEVLAKHFGWEPSSPWALRAREGRREAGGQKFSLEQVERKRYAAAQASLSRATRRLQARGFVVCMTGVRSRWSGVNLTDKGIDAAQVALCGEKSDEGMADHGRKRYV